MKFNDLLRQEQHLLLRLQEDSLRHLREKLIDNQSFLELMSTLAHTRRIYQNLIEIHQLNLLEQNTLMPEKNN